MLPYCLAPSKVFNECLLLRVIKGVGRANVGYCPSPGGSVLGRYKGQGRTPPQDVRQHCDVQWPVWCGASSEPMAGAIGTRGWPLQWSCEQELGRIFQVGQVLQDQEKLSVLV